MTNLRLAGQQYEFCALLYASSNLTGGWRGTLITAIPKTAILKTAIPITATPKTAISLNSYYQNGYSLSSF